MNPQKTARKGYSVTEFCAAYPISRSELFKLWEAGKGPKRRRAGRRKYVILVEDAEAWWNSREVEDEGDADDKKDGDAAAA